MPSVPGGQRNRNPVKERLEVRSLIVLVSLIFVVYGFWGLGFTGFMYCICPEMSGVGVFFGWAAANPPSKSLSATPNPNPNP